jgi:hypothetical protein
MAGGSGVAQSQSQRTRSANPPNRPIMVCWAQIDCGIDGAVNDLLNGQLRPKQAICQSKNAG